MYVRFYLQYNVFLRFCKILTSHISMIGSYTECLYIGRKLVYNHKNT